MKRFNTPVNKAIVTGIVLILNVFLAAFGDNVLDMNEKQQIGTTVMTVILGVYAVWRVPNKKTSRLDMPTDQAEVNE